MMAAYSFRFSAADGDGASVVVRNAAGTVVSSGSLPDDVAITNEAFLTYTADLPAGDTYTATATVLGRSRTAVGVLDNSAAALSATYVRGELAYAESTTGAPATTVNAFGGTPDAVPGLSVTFTLTQTTRVNLEFTCPSARNNTANFGVGALIMSGATEVARAFVKDGTASMDMSLYVKRRLTLAAGTYTYTANYGYYGGGSASINAGATFPMVLQVTQV